MSNKYQEIARLKSKNVSNRKIADSLGLSRNSVNLIVKKMSSTKRTFQEFEVMEEQKIQEFFNFEIVPKRDTSYVMPDYEKLTKELSRPGVTMQLLWEEYSDECRLSGTLPYKLTQFKKYFNDHLNTHEFTDVLKNRAGVKIETDWAGSKANWTDPDTGEIQYGYLFVGVLPFSGYAFAKVYPNMKTESWIDAHIQMFNYFGGVTQIIVSDNLKTGVTKNTKDEIVLNKTYSDLAEYYSTTIVPTRVRHPRDKAMVENTVGKLTTALLAKMRNLQFFSIDEYNLHLEKELEKFNLKSFQKKKGSRFSIFNEIEKDTLTPLPPEPYELCEWKIAKVQKNSHISIRRNYYSVPHDLIGEEVQLKIYPQYFKVYYHQELVCTHTFFPSSFLGNYRTEPSHMPEKSNIYQEWNKERYLNWAKAKGEFVLKLITQIFEKSKVEQTCYQTVHSILKLADTYSDERLNSACQYALELNIRPIRKNLKYILNTNKDICQERKEKEESENTATTFLRGGDYFGK